MRSSINVFTPESNENQKPSGQDDSLMRLGIGDEKPKIL
jgi:hypothetical protein